jgi:poly(A) polymerase
VLRKPELESRLRYRASRDTILRAIREAASTTGVAVWLVGGYVRDAALGRVSGDVDLAAGRGADRLASALRAAWGTRGFRFRRRGVTTWRFRIGEREVDLVDAGHRGLDRDLLRRELTLNAIAFDLQGGRLHDPVGGLRDLRGGKLRAPREGVFREDPVRALRVARFLAELPEMRLTPKTRAAAEAVTRRLRRESVERIRDELNRLLTAPAPRRGLEAIDRLGALDAVLPELRALRSCTAGRDRPDVWRHTLDALDLSVRPARLPGGRSFDGPGAALALRWALLLHDIAKPDTLEAAPDGRPTFHGHEVLGARRADTILRRLRQSRELRRRVKRLVLFHLRPHHLADAGAPPRGMRRLVRESGDDLPLLLLHAACDAKASGAPDARRRWTRLRRVLVELHAIRERSRRHPLQPLLDGRDVMSVLDLPPGPEVGKLLARVVELQEAGRLRSRKEALAALPRIADTGGG